MSLKRKYGIIALVGLCVITTYFVIEGQDRAWISISNDFDGFPGNASYFIPKLLSNSTFGFAGFRYGHQSTTTPTMEIKDTRRSSHRRLDKTKEYQHRLHDIEEACHRRGTPQITQMHPGEMDGSLLVEKTHSIIYCNIAKVGSTFWKRLLTAIKSKGLITSPFQLRFGDINLMRFQTVRDQLPKSALKTFFKRAFSFMFVRDPYARLYSGYENKIYHPNMMFWKITGRKIVAAIRPNASADSLKYGHDVTFFEFVKFILKLWEEGKKINVHYAPMHTKCDPCSMPYHFLGKLETFKDDADYLLALWKDKYPDITINFADFEKETAMDTGRGHIRFLFQAWGTLKHHINYSFYDLLQRTWSDFQIRGFLSKNIPLPFKPSEVSHLTREDVEAALQRALEMPANRTEVKLQREEALIQAYRTVPLEYMEKLRQYVLKDCQLFGYDDRPEKLFNRSVPYTNGHLYMKGIYDRHYAYTRNKHLLPYLHKIRN